MLRQHIGPDGNLPKPSRALSLTWAMDATKDVSKRTIVRDFVATRTLRPEDYPGMYTIRPLLYPPMCPETDAVRVILGR